VRRAHSGNRELPGGRVELGESATAAVKREVLEESGVSITITGLVGVYSDPGHLMVYPDTGEVRHQFAVCFNALPSAAVRAPTGIRACPADHGTGSRSQILIEARSMVPRNV
jgi:ADP-ribose pyrophosphatase YjhB (NUDIX family)